MNKNYNGFILEVDDFKENGKFQFTLNTAIPFIDTNKDFETPELAFEYAEEKMKEEFSKIITTLDEPNVTKEKTLEEIKEQRKKQAYIFIGKIVGLRHAVHLLELKYNSLQSHEPHDIFEDDFSETTKHKTQLNDAHTMFIAMGERYGNTKSYFRHNFSEFHSDLKKELWRAEQEIKGNNKKNIERLELYLDAMSNTLIQNEKNLHDSLEYQEAIKKEETKAISKAHYVKDLKERFLSFHIKEIEELNKYLDANTMRPFRKDLIPKKTADILKLLNSIKETIKSKGKEVEAN